MATFTWTGHGKHSGWAARGNWSPGGGPPGAGDLALFDTGINSAVIGDATVGGIEFLGAQTVSFAGAITAEGLAGLPYAVTVGLNAQIAFGAGASLTAPSLEVGVGGGSSTLTMAGAALTTTRAVIGGDKVSQGVVSIDHAEWSDAKSLVIGSMGFGALSLGAGADVFVGVGGTVPGNVEIGVHRGADGSLDLNGGAYMYITGNLAIGGALGAASHGVGQVNVGPNSVLDALSGTITVNDGSSVGLATGYFNAGLLNVAQGALIEGSGRIIASSLLENNGEIRASGFLDIAGPVQGNGVLEIGADSALYLEQSVLQQASISFLGGGGELGLDQFVSVAAPVEGFGVGDSIAAAFVDNVSWDQSTGILTLMTGDSVDGTLALTGDFSQDVFKVHEVGSVGTITVVAGHI